MVRVFLLYLQKIASNLPRSQNRVMRQNYEKIKDDWQLAKIMHSDTHTIKRCAFVSVNLTAETELALSHNYKDCIFMGCTLPSGFKKQTKECLFFPKMGELFYLCSHLYSAEELYEGYVIGDPTSYDRCYDGKVYKHFLKMGKRAENIKETLARTLHDHAISDCLHQFLSGYKEKCVVGIMGGHGLLRTDPFYEKIVYLSKALTEKGFLMVSGGGPGAMEATHLGAWMAGRTEEDVENAMQHLRPYPKFTDAGWLDSAMEVKKQYPQYDYNSLGIPTWLYGHEPSTPLATHIAKYFDNSIREDGILSIAHGGIVYTPGSAGTLQEIFQEAVQNHYLSFGYACPMIFMGKEYWTKEMPIWTLLTYLMEKGKYKNLKLTLSDSQEEIIQTLECSKDDPTAIET